MEKEFLYSDDRQGKVEQAINILQELHSDSSFVLVQFKKTEEGDAFDGNAIVSMHNEEYADKAMIEALQEVAEVLDKEHFTRQVTESGLTADEFIERVFSELKEVDDECEESE